MARDHRRLAAIVSLDVAGYSRLMGVDDSGTLAALKAHRRELIDPKIAEHDGRIVKTTGDGLLLEFPSVVDAVRCAVDVQRGMAERNAGIAPDQRLDFRIGINVGDIIIDGDDIFGDGVNVAARLEALADPVGDLSAPAIAWPARAALRRQPVVAPRPPKRTVVLTMTGDSGACVCAAELATRGVDAASCVHRLATPRRPPAPSQPASAARSSPCGQWRRPRA